MQEGDYKQEQDPVRALVVGMARCKTGQRERSVWF